MPPKKDDKKAKDKNNTKKADVKKNKSKKKEHQKRVKARKARPSARAYFDRGSFGPVYYDGKVHIMAFRTNGSPYWKVAM